MTRAKGIISKYYHKALDDFGSSFYHDPVVIVMVTVFLLLSLALLLLLIFRVQVDLTQVPMTYSVVYGVTYSSAWYGLYWYLVALIGMGTINFLIAWAYFDKERLISYLMGCTNIILAALVILLVFNLTKLAA